jgi:pimeloyl-ACP methyl ester carboxylesterase
MATFALVHGAWHGAWCWQFLIPELAGLGHQSIVMDLPIDQPTTPSDWAATVADALRDNPPAIVVGHSMAGTVVPLVADLIPIRGLVYLCAFTRRPGQSLASDREAGVNVDFTVAGFGAEIEYSEDGFSRYVKPDAIVRDFYHDCDAERAAWAAKRLRRQHTYWAEVSRQPAWPAVPTASIICTDDHSISPAWQRRIAKDWFGVVPIEMPGSHSPFLSRPRELAAILDRIEREKVAS